MGKESSLVLSLDVANKNSETPFEFTTALHTYFKVPDVSNVSISGLQGLQYKDKTLEGVPTLTEEREQVTLAGWTDRVYLGSGEEQVINNTQGGKIVFKKKQESSGDVSLSTGTGALVHTPVVTYYGKREAEAD